MDSDNEPHTLPRDILAQIALVILIPQQASGLNLTDEQKQELFGRVINVPAPGPGEEPVFKPARARRAKPVDQPETMVEGIDGVETEMTEMTEMLNQAIAA